MDQPEFNTQSFVIKIWLEETAEEAGQATWRGHITHIPSGVRRYLKGLEDIIVFIVPYLEQVGVKFGLGWRVSRWLMRWNLSPARRDTVQPSEPKDNRP
jgi:hypothetical protein